MSDYIPFDIQIQIINKLPVRSLIQFRSVSKTWKSVIDSSEFIAGYGVRHTDPPRLLIRVFATDDDVISTNNLILSFDLITQEFRVIDLPDVLSHQLFVNLSISKICESLSVFEYKTSIVNQIFDVWMMEDGVTRSFRKILTINAPYTLIKVLGFAKNGNAIIETVDDIEESAAVKVYEPTSEHFNDLEIYGEDNSYFVSSYMETLLLLDQWDSTIYS